MSLRAMLRRLTLIGMLPLLVAAIFLTVDEIRTLKARSDHNAQSLARSVAAAIDDRLATQIAALQVLAASPFADDASRLEDLHRQAEGLHQSLGAHVIFADLSMQMLLNTRVPLGTPLPILPRPRGHAAVPIALESGGPAVGDIFPGPIAKESLVAVAVPVMRDGAPRAVLLSILETRQFQKILDSATLSAELAVAVLDGKDETMAARMPADFTMAPGTAPRDGRFVTRPELAPWAVVLDVPAATYRAPVVTAAMTLGAGVLIAVGIGFLGAAVMGRRLARAVASLADPAAPAEGRSAIDEIEEAREALIAAGAAREAAEKNERRSRKHFQATFEQAAVGIAHVAPDGHFLRLNSRFCEIAGRPYEDLLQGSFPDITHPDDLDRDVENVHRLLNGEADTYVMQKRYVRPNDEIVWVNLTVSLVRRSDGSPDFFVSVVEDITERKLLEDQLRQALKMEAVGQLTGGLAHDLNNVLSIISMNVELINVSVGGNPTIGKHVDAAFNGVRRASDLTRKLLDFSRTEEGATERVSLNTYVKGIEDLIAKSLTPAIALKIALAEDSWAVDVNTADFEAALLNLAINARDAMPKGGTLFIETANKLIDETYVSCNPGSSIGEYAMISVSDTGIGMTPEVAAKAVEPFFTTKEVGKGTGLGLSMVYGFVRRSGGHLKIYSEPGRGTTVRLYLPRAYGANDQKSPPVPDSASLPRGNETILVVDDEPDLVDAAAAILQSLGYCTLTAGNGQEALDILAREDAIDLLFSDVVMPRGMDGYQLAIEALKLRPDLAVLLTSGFTRRREELVNGERELACHLANNLLPKPHNTAELALAVRRALDRVPAHT